MVTSSHEWERTWVFQVSLSSSQWGYNKSWVSKKKGEEIPKIDEIERFLTVMTLKDLEIENTMVNPPII